MEQVLVLGLPCASFSATTPQKVWPRVIMMENGNDTKSLATCHDGNAFDPGARLSELRLQATIKENDHLVHSRVVAIAEERL
jgi:hypothetical protein